MNEMETQKTNNILKFKSNLQKEKNISQNQMIQTKENVDSYKKLKQHLWWRIKTIPSQKPQSWEQLNPSLSLSSTAEIALILGYHISQ